MEKSKPQTSCLVYASVSTVAMPNKIVSVLFFKLTFFVYLFNTHSTKQIQKEKKDFYSISKKYIHDCKKSEKHIHDIAVKCVKIDF